MTSMLARAQASRATVLTAASRPAAETDGDIIIPVPVVTGGEARDTPPEAGTGTPFAARAVAKTAQVWVAAAKEAGAGSAHHPVHEEQSTLRRGLK
jgi:hypothetical protein